jgi:hypothetical protein
MKRAGQRWSMATPAGWPDSAPHAAPPGKLGFQYARYGNCE